MTAKLSAARRIWAAPTLFFVASVLLFSLNLDRAPDPDELHHVLAAEKLFETGVPSIGDGEYRRGMLHTWLVAASYEIFGPSLAAARVPGLLLMALVVALVYGWVRREAGAAAAIITGLVVLTSPFTIEIAQFSRFYALQIVFFVLGCWGVFYAAETGASISRRIGLAVFASLAFLLAISQQVTSLFGIAGVSVWLFGLMASKAIDPGSSEAYRKSFLISLLALCIIGVFAFAFTDIPLSLLDRYRFTPVFNIGLQNEHWFYFVRYFLFYPTLWTLVGILSLLAIASRPRLGWFAVCVFAISFLLASFAGSKATRYISFAPPFLAIIWGIGLSAAWRQLSELIASARGELRRSLPKVGARQLSSGFVVAAVTIVLLANPFWIRSATMIADVPLPNEIPNTNWNAARESLGPWVRDAEIMITTEELGAIYFLGRSDVRYSPSKLPELEPDQQKEFGIDYRVGRPVISKPDSLRMLISCFRHGFIVGPADHWGKAILIGREEQEILYEHAAPITVPEESHVYAWGWDRETESSIPDYCDSIRRFSGIGRVDR